jgi:hypothetical protein
METLIFFPNEVWPKQNFRGSEPCRTNLQMMDSKQIQINNSKMCIIEMPPKMT